MKFSFLVLFALLYYPFVTGFFKFQFFHNQFKFASNKLSKQQQSPKQPTNSIFRNQIIFASVRPDEYIDVDVIDEENDNTLIPNPNYQDMGKLAMLLTNITECFETQPEGAMTLVSSNLGWLYTHNITALTEMILQNFPEIRHDLMFRKAYEFVLNFMELIAEQTSNLLKRNQNLLRRTMEACRVSEGCLDGFIIDNFSNLTSPEFLVFLNAEIEGQRKIKNEGMASLLVTIKLRVLDEQGKAMGVDVQMLPILAAEPSLAELQRKTKDHLARYDADGVQLFLQTLRLMRSEMNKRYGNVDMNLQVNLREIERIASICANELADKAKVNKGFGKL